MKNILRGSNSFYGVAISSIQEAAKILFSNTSVPPSSAILSFLASSLS